MVRLSALFILSTMLAWAQAGLATLTGSITDPSGAVIANAPVSATHTTTGTILTAVTSSTGNYSISNMPIGTYEVSVAMPGFKTYHREGISLALQQTLRMDVALEVGATGESITVTAESTMLKTDSGQVTHNITMREIQNLPVTPVSGIIRDPFSVAQLIPGVRYIPVAPPLGNTMLINGLPTSAVQYRIEGQVMGNTRAGFTSNTQQVQPSVDAIEEVAIVTSNYSAEYGSVAGALFNVTMRSGGNQYHGSVYDYAVNEMLNAHDPGVHLRNKIRRHDWGVTFGGPVQIPGLYKGKNKTFFFFGYERYNQTQISVVGGTLPTVPIQAYRDGDYSRLLTLSGNQNLRIGTGAAARDYLDPLGSTVRAGTIFDSASTRQVTCDTALSQDCGTAGTIRDYRTAYPGNKIPVTAMDKVALAIQSKYIPLPQGSRADNGEVINNYLNPFSNDRLSIIPSLKIDHNFSTKGRLSGYWQVTDTKAPRSLSGEGFNDTITAALGTYQVSTSARINYDYTIGPKLQFHLGAAWSHFNWSNATLVTNFNPSEAIGLNGVRLNRQFPFFGANTQTTATGVGLGGMNAMGPSTQGLNPERRPAGNASLTWIQKNHTVKFGSEWRMDMLPTLTYSNTAGNFGTLGNGITWQPALQGVVLSGTANLGFPYAEFLLGSVRGFTMSTPIAYRVSKQQWGLYLQDTWRVKRGLTIDYGLRWDYGTYSKEDYGRNAGLSLTEPNPSAGGRAGALIYESKCKCQFAQNYPYGIGPRLGFAYTLNPKTVFRGGFGISYGSTGTFGGFTQNSATAATQLSGFDNFKLRDGIPSSINPQWPVFDPGLGHTPGTVIGPQALLDPNAGRPTRTYQWNLSLQREITRNLVIEASYVANRGVWQDASGLVSHNSISEAELAKYGFTVGNADDATMLNTALNRLSATQTSTLAARGVRLPYSNFPTTQTVTQSVRPFPQYTGGISATSAPLGKSWYDGLQVSVIKRYSKGLQVNSNFTWSKNLSAQTAPDVFNRNYGNKDIDSFNLPWRVRVNFEYQLPSKLPLLSNRFISNALGGWGVAMTLSYQAAAYIGRPASGATAPISQWLGGRGPGGAQLKRNSDGSYMNPWAVNWVDSNGKTHAEPLDINCHCFDPEKTLVLNPTVWEAVPDAKWAADAQRLPFFRGVRLPQESANLSRNFRFGGDKKRYTLQVRVEFQNVLNRLKLPGAPQIAGFNFNTAPTPIADGRYTSGFGSFGNLRSGTAYGAERTGMFVGRLTF